MEFGALWPYQIYNNGSKSWHSWSFAKYSDIGLVTISFPACCVSHMATGLPVMVHDMHTRRRRPDYLQACPTGLPVDGVKSALTPALWPCGPVPFAVTPLEWVTRHSIVHFGDDLPSQSLDWCKKPVWLSLVVVTMLLQPNDNTENRNTD